MTEWTDKETWLKSLKLQQSHLRYLEADKLSSAQEVAEAQRRVERIWQAGLAEWQAEGRPSRLP